MVDPVRGTSNEPVRAAPATAGDRERSDKFSSTLAAWMSRGSAIRANYAGGEEHEDPEPEPIKASAPIIAPDVSKA